MLQQTDFCEWEVGGRPFPSFNVAQSHGAMEPTLFNTLGMDSITNCKPGLITPHQPCSRAISVFLEDWRLLKKLVSAHCCRKGKRCLSFIAWFVADVLTLKCHLTLDKQTHKYRNTQTWRLVSLIFSQTGVISDTFGLSCHYLEDKVVFVVGSDRKSQSV